MSTISCKTNLFHILRRSDENKPAGLDEAVSLVNKTQKNDEHRP